MTRETLRMIEKLQLAEIYHEVHAGMRKIYINDVPATEEDVAELQRRLRLGIERATGKICNGAVYYNTN